MNTEIIIHYLEQVCKKEFPPIMPVISIMVSTYHQIKFFVLILKLGLLADSNKSYLYTHMYMYYELNLINSYVIYLPKFAKTATAKMKSLVHTQLLHGANSRDPLA